ncbi:MAG: hypothetical protein KIT79_06860 [Deltaproteobacteria bacterium]|nr:hypothetical protein [Deltaproteobacteria bacterium]
MEDPKVLADLFSRLGARHPERWAKSQIEEGIPQLARYLFLRQAWKHVVDPNGDWIADSITTENRDLPGGNIGPALNRIVAQGATHADINTIVRIKQWELLSRLCHLIDDPDLEEDEVKSIGWRLFLVNENDEPIEIIPGLHESVLEVEPTGYEMRPAK